MNVVKDDENDVNDAMDGKINQCSFHSELILDKGRTNMNGFI